MGSPMRRCPGCGLELPPGEGGYDGYFHTSPECWAVFTRVVGVEFQDAVLFGQVHQLSVDAYAVQHAGGRHPDKSVDVHLVGLHLVLERDFKPTDVPRVMQRLASGVSAWPHFSPPVDRGRLTVLDVAGAKSPVEHAQRVREWAQIVWACWEQHHGSVAALAEGCFARRR